MMTPFRRTGNPFLKRSLVGFWSLRAEGCCYDFWKLMLYFKKPWRMLSSSEVLLMHEVPHVDRLWVLANCFMSPRGFREFLLEQILSATNRVARRCGNELNSSTLAVACCATMRWNHHPDSETYDAKRAAVNEVRKTLWQLDDSIDSERVRELFKLRAVASLARAFFVVSAGETPFRGVRFGESAFYELCASVAFDTSGGDVFDDDAYNETKDSLLEAANDFIEHNISVGRCG